GQEINIYADNVKEKYREIVINYFKDLKNKCLQYQIDYVPLDIHSGFYEVLTNYLVRRRKFL
ncbi:MAG: DUF58 domain-containing protein, partial [Polaribacter sp.]